MLEFWSRRELIRFHILIPSFSRDLAFEAFSSARLRVSLASQLLVDKPAADNLLQDDTESFRIGHLAIVIAKRLLVNVPEQVERLNAHVRSVQAALQETPKVLHSVCVGVAFHIRDGVVYNFVFELIGKRGVGVQFIAEDRRASFNVFADVPLKFWLAPTLCVNDANGSTALHHSEYDFFPACTRAADLLLTLFLMHIAGLATDKSEMIVT